ncbi:MAG: GatB/YqeY domain-containing protein [Ignavibacteriaceae bacterium]
MNLKEKINEDLKIALKSGDKTRLLTIRSIRTLILEFENSGTAKEMKEEDELNLLRTAAKKRKDSIEQYRKAKREDLAQSEEKELEIIMSYLPKQLNESEIESTIKVVAAQIGATTKKDFGKLMSAGMKELKGKADGNIVREIVEKILSES